MKPSYISNPIFIEKLGDDLKECLEEIDFFRSFFNTKTANTHIRELNKVDTFEEFIDSAFPWNTSNRGYDYWEEVSHR